SPAHGRDAARGWGRPPLRRSRRPPRPLRRGGKRGADRPPARLAPALVHVARPDRAPCRALPRDLPGPTEPRLGGRAALRLPEVAARRPPDPATRQAPGPA